MTSVTPDLGLHDVSNSNFSRSSNWPIVFDHAPCSIFPNISMVVLLQPNLNSSVSFL